MTMPVSAIEYVIPPPQSEPRLKALKSIRKYRVSLVRDGDVKMPRDTAESFEEARDLFFELLKDSPVERIYVAYLSGYNRVIGVECVAQGGLHGCAITPKDVFRGALIACASAIIIAHNHPSGDPSPSPEDVMMTRKLMEVADLIGMPILDHIIVTQEPGVASSLLDYGALNRG